MKLFYKIWVDMILFRKSRPLYDGSWKSFTLTFMTILLSVNIFTFYGMLVKLGLTEIIYSLQFFSFIPFEGIKITIWNFFMVFFPAFLINYFLIFDKNKYVHILIKYESSEMTKGTLTKRYTLVSILLFWGMVLVTNFL